MKRSFILLLCLMNMMAMYSQFFYDKDSVFQENGYAYQCDVMEGAAFVSLYNKDTHFINTVQIDKNTGQEISIRENEGERQIDDPQYQKPPLVHQIVCNAFTGDYKEKVKGIELGVSLYIDSATGKIADVSFEFLSIEPFATIPVSVYRQIELGLKKQIRFNLTQAGKRRNYVFQCWLMPIE